MIKYSELNLGQIEAIGNKLGGMDGIARLLADELVVVEKASLKPVASELTSFLEFVGTVKLPAQPSFVARDHFKVDTGKKAVVKIAWMGSNFENNFLGKTEEAVDETELAIRKLKKDLLDKEIRPELGSDKEEITLSQFYALLAKQGGGQQGELLVNGYANIAYIRDQNDKLWAVHARWYSDGGGWYVSARSVTYPRRWYAGRRVVSRN